jgi:hypothetical protein
MTAAAAVACPRCQRPLAADAWLDAESGACTHCFTAFEFVAFPALHAVRAQIAPQAAVLAADSVCFFHAENRAEAICDGCGRLLCRVCSVPFAGQKLCPTCIAATKASTAPNVTRERVLYDGIALTLAALPLLIWPLTVLTAPAALAMVVYGWKKPSSLVRGRSTTRLVIAAIIAGSEIVGWVILLAIWLSRR